ncbi:MAG: putative lipid II flippase FtsW [Oligoflexia bacterium]|nr:putative lipid II flippase FtsW [Oligoflexia bacterium]
MQTTHTPQVSRLKPPLFVDAGLVMTVLILVGFSIIMVYSTTAIVAQERYGDAYYFVKRQGIAAGLGLCLMLLLSRCSVEWLRRWSPFMLFACLGLLLITLIPGVGHRAGGAQRWINLGLMRFQPAEAVKVFFIVFIAGYWSRHETKIPEFVPGVVKPFMLVALVAGLLLMQPDFGSAAVIAVVTLAMALAAGVRLRYVLYSGLVAAICACVLVVVSPYRMQRIVSFLAPWEDASGKGYQLIQSLIAVGTGQATGLGLGGSQQKLFFLPAAHTDFIFAVVAEELGFVGSICLLAIFLVLMWRGLRLAASLVDDTFAFSLAVGLTLLLVAPALLNIGVVIGLLPTKGMVLPLVGYGGSSIVTCLAAVGLLLALKRHEGAIFR